eukprot:tig00021572_g22397.t1
MDAVLIGGPTGDECAVDTAVTTTTKIYCHTPASAAGETAALAVTVIVDQGPAAAAKLLLAIGSLTSSSYTTKAGAFQYLASKTPSVSFLNPPAGMLGDIMMIVPLVQSISGSLSSTAGGLLLTIAGSSFSPVASLNSVTVAGVACPVVFSSYEVIVCQTRPGTSAAGTSSTHFSGPRGWYGINSIASLKASPAFPGSPDLLQVQVARVATPDTSNVYTERFSGWFVAPKTSAYTFFLGKHSIHDGLEDDVTTIHPKTENTPMTIRNLGGVAEKVTTAPYKGSKSLHINSQSARLLLRVPDAPLRVVERRRLLQHQHIPTHGSSVAKSGNDFIINLKTCQAGGTLSVTPPAGITATSSTDAATSFVGGQISFSAGGYTTNPIDIESTAAQVVAAFEAKGLKVAVNRTGPCFTQIFDIEFQNLPGDLALTTVYLSSLTDGGTYSVSKTSPGGLFYSTLPGEFVATVETRPQLSVRTNGIPAGCARDALSNSTCGFDYSGDVTPVVSSTDKTSGKAADTITFAGSFVDDLTIYDVSVTMQTDYGAPYYPSSQRRLLAIGEGRDAESDHAAQRAVNVGVDTAFAREFGVPHPSTIRIARPLKPQPDELEGDMLRDYDAPKSAFDEKSEGVARVPWLPNHMPSAAATSAFQHPSRRHLLTTWAWDDTNKYYPSAPWNYVNKLRAVHGSKGLVWHDKTAAFAQYWAEKLRDESMMQHSNEVGTNTRYGENLRMQRGGFYGVASIADIDADDILTKGFEALQSWYNEVNYYDFETAWVKAGLTNMVGHFTCLVWDASDYYGMGVAFNPATQTLYVVYESLDLESSLKNVKPPVTYTPTPTPSPSPSPTPPVAAATPTPTPSPTPYPTPEPVPCTAAAGTYSITLSVLKYGYATGNFQFTYNLAATGLSTTTSGTLGGASLTITGEAMGPLFRLSDVSVLIGSSVCTVASSTYSKLVCKTPAMTADAGGYTVSVALAGQTANVATKLVIDSAKTPTVTAINPATCGDFGELLTFTISGTNFGGMRGDSGAVDAVATVGGLPCVARPTSTAASLVCDMQTALPAGSTQLPVAVTVPDYGIASSSVTLTVSTAVTAISPSSGSLFGGQRITLTGAGFPTNASTLNSITLVASSSPTTTSQCVTDSTSVSAFVCTLFPSASIKRSGVAVPMGSAVFGAVSVTFPQSVSFAFDPAKTPVLYALSPAAGSLGSIVTITGANFPAGQRRQLLAATDPVVKFGDAACNVTAWDDHSIECVANAAILGPGLVSVNFPTVGLANNTAQLTFRYAAEILSINSGKASVNGGLNLRMNISHQVFLDGISPTDALVVLIGTDAGNNGVLAYCGVNLFLADQIACRAPVIPSTAIGMFTISRITGSRFICSDAITSCQVNITAAGIPQITNFTSNSGVDGDLLTIYGTFPTLEKAGA